MRSESHLSRSSRRRALALAIFTGLALTSWLEAASVRGRVIYFNGAPAAGIAIRLTNAKGGSPFSYSGRNGVYVLNGIPAGNYTLEVWQNRAVVSRQPISVREPTSEAPVTKLP